jgi:hypothetical protein
VLEARHRVNMTLDIMLEALRSKGIPTVKRSDGMKRVEGKPGMPGAMALVSFPSGVCTCQIRFNLGEPEASYKIEPEFDLEASRQDLMQ